MGKDAANVSQRSDLELRAEGLLRVSTATDDREARSVEFLRRQLQHHDHELLPALRRYGDTSSVAQTLVQFAQYGGNLRDFMSDAIDAMAQGYGVEDYASKVVKIIDALKTTPLRDEVLRRLGYLSPAPRLLSLERRYAAVEIAHDYLDCIAERESIVLLLDAVGDRSPDELDLVQPGTSVTKLTGNMGDTFPVTEKEK